MEFLSSERGSLKVSEVRRRVLIDLAWLFMADIRCLDCVALIVSSRIANARCSHFRQLQIAMFAVGIKIVVDCRRVSIINSSHVVISART